MAAGTLVRRVLLQINADDGDTEAKLDKISLKADELAAKHPELKVRIDTAAASAKVAVLRGELRDLSRQADEEALKGGILSRFLGGLGGGGGGGIPSGIPGIGGLSGGGAAAGIGAAIPVIAGLLVELDGLVSGFAAAGAGAAAFGLLALPAFKSVSDAYTQINTDQQAYNRALTATARNTALQHLKQDYANLSPAQRQAVRGVQNLVDTWHKMSSAFAPQAFKIFTDFLQIADNLLPDIVPFANTFANALDKLLKQAGKFTESKGFKDWLAQFQKLEGPAIGAIGTGIGHIVVNLGKLLTLMSKKDVVNAINIAFSVLDGTIIGLAGAIHYTMLAWDRITTHIDQGRHQIAQAFDAVRHASATLAHGIAMDFDQQRHTVASFADSVGHLLGNVVTFFRRLPGEIMSALAALPGLMLQAGEHAISSLISGLESIPVVGPIAGIVGKIASFLPHSPAKTGPLSGSGDPLLAGREIGLRLAAGMGQSTSAASAAAARMARAAGITPSGRLAAAGAAAGGGVLRLEVVGNSNDLLVTLLKKNVRIRSGNPGVLGR